MPSSGEGTKESGDSAAALSSLAVVPFKRRFVVPGVVLALLELLAIGYPLWSFFDLGSLGADTLLRTALPVCIGAILVWIGAITMWLLPLWSAVAARRRGDKVSKELASRAYKITLKGPVRVLLLRTCVWTIAAGLTGLFLYVYGSWPLNRVAEITALAAAHSYIVSCLRAVWWAQILGGPREAVRGRLAAQEVR